ncbi:DUF1622 domain-containing protein [Arthrobacter caoxuetaonis]|uniref:DUF1622 domain-containing protein n=1 Tax=Arthrobacter caoxuetaonis TaxID=2886935 RepID=A0A9X1MEC5_9MICC|nr:DUF1622 domain-containing protein [Arthrobacter caoxuetaonis]MCC3282902.1 DUF1622 domain-containing protein [Arthrobacter caoxuetaonis]MCC3298036.1 DUF1622 domain-containing protein [Arthrobacter caoxuetaonis]USQ57049.1 DUF1622 domain-containing protein [Arthrobacter caoxuetaonis]
MTLGSTMPTLQCSRGPQPPRLLTQEPPPELSGILARRADVYEMYRQQLGRAILLGLELLVAADIIRTVAVTPTFESLGVLAVIVLIRTFLSYSLQLEVTGKLPWQQPVPEKPSPAR